MANSTTITVPAARRDTKQQALPTITPRVDIYETDDAFVLVADMPGVAPEALEIVAERDSLIVRGRVAPRDVAPEYSEFELGDYYREFTLTEDIETDNASASIRDGVLRVELRKSPRVQPRKIPVRTD